MLATVIFSIFFAGLQPEVPDTLTLEYCYSRVENHYPLARKIELQDEITDLNKKIVNTASYPQLNFGAAATYQSEVTDLPFPAGGQFIAPELSKDQYKITMDVSQSIYNGGAVDIKKNLEEIRGEQQQQTTKVLLHQLKEQINQVYFGILLARQQLKIVETLMESLRSQLKSVRSSVKNGALLPSQQYILEAELIKSQQDSADIQSNIRSGYGVLSQLIGEEISPDISLEVPDHAFDSQVQDSLVYVRPEFDLYESNRKVLDYQKGLSRANKLPSLSAFGTAAYGRPGFNVFEDDPHPYYIVGLRLQWNFWESRNAATRQQAYNLQQKSITEEERAFKRQLKASLSKIEERIQSLEDQIARDEEILKLREKAVAEVSSQMKNGTATATEYISELNKAIQARLSMLMNKTKLSRAKIDYQTTLGISNNR
jgi:outer membrane protein TolC